MRTSVQNGDGARIVKVGGTVDLESSPELQTVLQAALRGAPGLTIDLAEVSYIDSSGVATLIQALKRANQDGIELRLRDPAPRVLAVLEIAHLTRLFTIDRADPS